MPKRINTYRYEPAELQKHRESNLYHVRTYRKDSTITKEEIMEEFISFVTDEFEMSDSDLSDLQCLADAFVGYDSKKAIAGEKELLARWKKSVEL